MRCGYECISGGCKEGSEQARWGIGLGLGQTLTLTLALTLTLTQTLTLTKARWVPWMGFAMGGALVYTVGIPTFLGLILYSNHKKLVLQTPRCQKRYGFLYAKYEDRAWYWELVEMFRKLLFTSLIMFLAQGTATQIVVAMFISFCWLIGHLIIQAYKETADSWLQTCSMLGIFLSL